MTYVDEVHAVACTAARRRHCRARRRHGSHRCDRGHFGQGIRLPRRLYLRHDRADRRGALLCAGLIFTTALPPSVCAAATAAIRHLKTSQWERERHQDRAARTKAVLTAARLPVMTSPTHIVPVYVGNPELCKEASDLLLSDHGIYIQPINYPTVAKGKERLRITPSPYHDDGLIDTLAEALVDVWQRLNLPLADRALAAE